MNEPTESVLSIFKREPDETQRLLKVGVAGPIIVVAWDRLASMFLGSLPVALVDIVLLMAYASVVVYLVARMVNSVNRWEVNSAIQARRLMANKPGHYEEVSVPAPAPSGASFFHEAYFLMQLNDEVLRARREGGHLSVVSIDVTIPGNDHSQAMLEKVAFDMAHLSVNHGRTMHAPLAVGESEFVFSLPDLAPDKARSFISDLLKGLGEYWCHCGVVVYPDDGTDAQTLVERARERCEASRRGQAAASRAAIA